MVSRRLTLLALLSLALAAPIDIRPVDSAADSTTSSIQSTDDISKLAVVVTLPILVDRAAPADTRSADSPVDFTTTGVQGDIGTGTVIEITADALAPINSKTKAPITNSIRPGDIYKRSLLGRAASDLVGSIDVDVLSKSGNVKSGNANAHDDSGLVKRTDILNLVDAKRVPVSVLNDGSVSNLGETISTSLITNAPKGSSSCMEASQLPILLLVGIVTPEAAGEECKFFTSNDCSAGTELSAQVLVPKLSAGEDADLEEVATELGIASFSCVAPGDRLPE